MRIAALSTNKNSNSQFNFVSRSDNIYSLSKEEVTRRPKSRSKKGKKVRNSDSKLKEENLKNSQEKEALLKTGKKENIGTVNDSDTETDVRKRQKPSTK